MHGYAGNSKKVLFKQYWDSCRPRIHNNNTVYDAGNENSQLLAGLNLCSTCVVCSRHLKIHFNTR